MLKTYFLGNFVIFNTYNEKTNDGQGCFPSFCYFPSKKFFERKIFNSLVFFLFLKLSMTRRLRVCRVVGGLHNTCRIPPRLGSPQVPSSNPAIDRISLRLFRYSSTRSDFLTAKVGFLDKNFGFFGILAFSKNYPFSDVTETKLFLFNIFFNLRKNFRFS